MPEKLGGHIFGVVVSIDVVSVVVTWLSVVDPFSVVRSTFVLVGSVRTDVPELYVVPETSVVIPFGSVGVHIPCDAKQPFSDITTHPCNVIVK